MPTDHSEYLQRIKPLIEEADAATAAYHSWGQANAAGLCRHLTGEEKELQTLNYALATQRYYAATEALNAARAEYILSQQIEGRNGL